MSCSDNVMEFPFSDPLDRQICDALVADTLAVTISQYGRLQIGFAFIELVEPLEAVRITHRARCEDFWRAVHTLRQEGKSI